MQASQCVKFYVKNVLENLFLHLTTGMKRAISVPSCHKNEQISVILPLIVSEKPSNKNGIFSFLCTIVTALSESESARVGYMITPPLQTYTEDQVWKEKIYRE